MIQLLPATFVHLNTLIETPDSFASQFSISVVQPVSHFPEALAYIRELAKQPNYSTEWNTHFIVLEAENKIIGIAGYKGEPNEKGEVEIGYEIHPSYQSRGFATLAAQLLTERALNDTRVQCVLAHTLPEKNASCRVLEKNGFVWKGLVHDPEDGDIWRWERI